MPDCVCQPIKSFSCWQVARPCLLSPGLWPRVWRSPTAPPKRYVYFGIWRDPWRVVFLLFPIRQYEINCPWMQETHVDWIYQGPVCAVLIINLTFLLRIMWVRMEFTQKKYWYAKKKEHQRRLNKLTWMQKLTFMNHPISFLKHFKAIVWIYNLSSDIFPTANCRKYWARLSGCFSFRF